jgi:hypothetical protein
MLLWEKSTPTEDNLKMLEGSVDPRVFQQVLNQVLLKVLIFSYFLAPVTQLQDRNKRNTGHI